MHKRETRHWWPDDVALAWCLKAFARAELVAPRGRLRALLPPWARLVRIGGGQQAGLHVLWDLRRPRRPNVMLPVGSAHVPVTRDDVVVDLGAYEGAYAVLCANAGARVVAYEPSPLSFAVLECNRTLLLEPRRAAVVGARGVAEVTLHVNTGLGISNNLVRATRGATAVRVPAVAYEDAIAGATVVKIDVEGAEYDYPILPVPARIRAVLLSFHKRADLDWRARAQAIMAGLAADGFTPVTALPRLTGAAGLGLEGAWVRV